jgi:hypothetical protein
MENNIEVYKDLLLQLLRRRNNNQNEDDILDKMDECWFNMTHEERKFVEAYAFIVNGDKDD